MYPHQPYVDTLYRYYKLTLGIHNFFLVKGENEKSLLATAIFAARFFFFFRQAGCHVTCDVTNSCQPVSFLPLGPELCFTFP